MKYSYSFSVWPNEQWSWNGTTIFDLFRQLVPRVEMDFTESEFNAFRYQLNKDGLTLREIERRPYHEAESIK